ncbi:TIGR01548 family HAD-type hydrolase [Spirulina sp. CS-785/01]|uniref:TIGR01548 family HAD-type hydrolase n=1 Tax=Spirulina sp. CS-785/01 TaxID=3021716 RepID=UPI002330ED3E|nr:TIGR01548 family HAD-type hydrolase [Spirulina sp. CS-785/01]MDB9314789.1 TIGR01548 family HAD-type hydrolase [Spirulina sp. CS-785/01]
MILIFDIDGVVRDVSRSYRRAIADTVEHYTQTAYRPTMADIDTLKSEGIWNNDWEASQELIHRYGESQGQPREHHPIDYPQLIKFFQSRYFGTNPETWDGYITTEPLLLSLDYLHTLSDNNIAWGFFSGATRGSAEYVLVHRLGIENPVIVAMEDAPSKPDPTGLFATIEQLEQQHQFADNTPVFYAGDTVADMYTITKAQEKQPQRPWIGVGVLPPHVQGETERSEAYSSKLEDAGASLVVKQITELTPEVLRGFQSYMTSG